MKTFIVTGAGKGMGYDTVQKLLDEQYNVIAISRNTAALDAIHNTKLKVIQADITTQIESIVEQIKGHKITGLLNNAGLLIKKDLEELNTNDFLNVYNTNVLAPFNLSRQLIPFFESNAHIVNIGSMGGFQDTSKFPGMIFYSSSKAALHCISQCLAVELKKFNINVNCLALGAVDTEMVKAAFPGFNAPISSSNMAVFLAWFMVNGANFFNGQIIPVQLNNM
jgi:3-oxoacyl-[acyl-carrier protein] reductase